MLHRGFPVGACHARKRSDAYLTSCRSALPGAISSSGFEFLPWPLRSGDRCYRSRGLKNIVSGNRKPLSPKDRARSYSSLLQVVVLIGAVRSVSEDAAHHARQSCAMRLPVDLRPPTKSRRDRREISGLQNTRNGHLHLCWWTAS